jgi:23S rRNA (cytidine1920-2'-O)/16S rRNA (cytidine1409-2'-O)-methyltransferase
MDDPPAQPAPPTFVSRAGRKLEHALQALDVDVRGAVCADFGCNVGGFTDCLLQRGAARVHAIDTGYGTLAWRLRQDERVVVMERTNALHAEPPDGGVDLVTIDLAWTPQRHALPAARKWLRAGGRIVTLVKPHYELDEAEKRTLLVEGRLDPVEAERVLERVLDKAREDGFEVMGHTKSPITGGKSAKKGRGNVEFLAVMSV